MNKDTLILVVYLAVAEMTQEEIYVYIKNCKMRVGISDNNKDCKMFFIPIRNGDSRIECINPQYLDKKEFDIKTSKAIHEMESSLDEFLEKYKPKEKKNRVIPKVPPSSREKLNEGVDKKTKTSSRTPPLSDSKPKKK